MSAELPKRIFKEGEETQVTQINNNCRIDYIITKFTGWMPNELAVVKQDPVFSQIFKLHENGLGYSARVIHSFLCRELLTYKSHELWFVFARMPLRFSLQEFHAVTEFECDTSISLQEFENYKYDGGFWSRVLRRKDRTVTLFNLWNKDKESVKKWKNADRIRLIYLAIILCVVLTRDEKANIPLKYIMVVMDLQKVRKYPWGVASYDLLCNSIAKNLAKLKDKTTSYVMDGFSYALQIWAMEAVPKIGKLCGKKLNKAFTKGPRCINWMGAAKVSYQEIIRLEQIFTPEDSIYAYISWTGNYDVVRAAPFLRDDVEDERIKVLMELISNKYEFSEHIWEFEETPEVSLDLADEADENDEGDVTDEAPVNVEAAESDEDFQTRNVGATSRKGKKRLPDRGMEKRKHKVLSGGPKHAPSAPFNEDMKAFMTQLFEQNIMGMEQRLQKQMAERFEQMKAELRDSHKEASVHVEHVEPSSRKPSPRKPSPSKSSTSQSSLRRSKCREGSQTPFDLNFGQADDIINGMGTQGVEGLSQVSYVPEIDPTQTIEDDDWWTPMTSVRGSKAKTVSKEKGTAPPPSQWKKWHKGKSVLQLSDSPLPIDGSPQSSLYNFHEEAWKGFTDWALNPTSLPIGPSIFNLFVAGRIVSAGQWLGSEKMDAFMFIWRVKTSLNLSAPKRVAFMSAMFCLQLQAQYNKFAPNKKAYELPDFLLGYGRGELPSHGRTDQVWGVDVDRLYFPLFVNGNHWIAICVNIIEKKVEVYDCSWGKNRQYVEKFTAMIPRIVKAVAPLERQKHHLLSAYSIVEVPMKLRLNKTCFDSGAYALKHLECLLLGLDLSLVDDEIIMGCRQKLGVDLWEAAQDPIYAEAMKRYVPSPWERCEVFDLED